MDILFKYVLTVYLIQTNNFERANSLADKNYVKYSTVIYVIYQTRETVFHRDIQTPGRQLKLRCAAEYF